MALGLALAGLLPWNSPWVLTLAPALGLLFLAITGVLLIADLEHPERFHMIFTRPQWRSWLVRGAFIITAYAAVLMLHIFLAMLGREHVIPAVAVVLGIPLAALTAVYTAYLFAQAKGRDLWQNPLGPTHLVVQALLVGAALMGAIEVVRAALQSGPVGVRTNPVMGILIGSLAILSAVHLLLLAGEHTLTHGTAHARLASREMTRGRFAPWFTAGLIFTAMGVLAPWLGAWTTLPVLLGVLAYEHAYVQAGQSVPLA
jgi:formate-dependent nitrite reductase membrane component NrfD